MRIDARSYCLLSEKKQSMFCALAGRSCLSSLSLSLSLSLLLFSNHNHPSFFSSLLSHASTIYSRSSCVRICLVDDKDDDDGGGIFLPSPLHTSRGKRGRRKKKKTRETLMNNALLFLDWSALLQILSPDRHTRHSIKFHEQNQ